MPSHSAVFGSVFLIAMSSACAATMPALAARPAPPMAAGDDQPSADIPRAPAAPIPLEEYFKIRRIRSRGGVLLSFSHDEKLVAYLSDEGGRADIWVKPVGGGPATQITHANGFVHSCAFSPVADVLIYEADHGGDELPHLFATDSQGTAARDLTADLAPGRRTAFVEWADDGKTFLYLPRGVSDHRSLSRSLRVGRHAGRGEVVTGC